MFVGNVSAQFQITGKLRTLRPLTLKIEDLNGKIIVECKIINGQEFKTDKTNIEDDLYIMTIGECSDKIIFSNNTVIMKGYFNDKNTEGNSLSMSGTEINEQLKIFIPKYSADGHNKTFQKSSEYIDKYMTDFPNTNPLVYAVGVYLNKDIILNYETFKHVLDKQDKRSKALVVSQIKNESTKRESYRLGGDAEEWTLVDKNENKVSLKDFKGKIVLLDFWASWCGPCRAEMKSLQKIYGEIKGDDIVFVSVSLDDDRGKWLKALEEDRIPWMALWEKAGFENSALRSTYGFNSIPFIVLIGKDGKTVARRLRGDNVKIEIEKLRNNK